MDVKTEESKKIQTRRVGSVTFGISLILFGVLFIIHIFVPALEYDVIFRCWPVVFIVLGCEILVENHRNQTAEQKFVYDFPAVAMLCLMLLFAMIMAAFDFALSHEGIYWYY